MPASLSGLPYAMHSTPVDGSGDTRDLPLVNSVDEQLQVFERRRWQDSVAEVEDVTRPPAGATEDLSGALAHKFRRAEQNGRVQVALDPAVIADSLPARIKRHAPV